MRTKKIQFVFLIAAVFFLIPVPAFAQLPGDLNCNGILWEISDAVIGARILIESCDASILVCTYINGDMDGDGMPLTLGDIIPMFFIINGGGNPLNFPRHPESDTIMVESAAAHPGETIALPLWINTIDTLVAIQFLLEIDPDYLELDSMIIYDDFPLTQKNCNGNIYCVTNQDQYFPVVLLPGDHHIGDIILNVNPDINQQVTTGLYFSSVPMQALYSGFANSTFFMPVMIDAEIQIVPMTSIDQPEYKLPREVEISVYPNPFNSNTNISVTSESAGELSIYDILGRPVRSFGFYNGTNSIRWDATNDSGQPIKTGIYFIMINNGRDYSFKKLLYLK